MHGFILILALHKNHRCFKAFDTQLCMRDFSNTRNWLRLDSSLKRIVKLFINGLVVWFGSGLSLLNQFKLGFCKAQVEPNRLGPN